MTSRRRARSRCSRPCQAELGAARIVGVGHRVVHGGLEFMAPTAVDAAMLQRLEQLRAARAAAPAAQPRGDPRAAGTRCRACRRSRASTRRSIARSPGGRAALRLAATRSPRRACGATDFTGCRTSTSPRVLPAVDARRGGRAHRGVPPRQRREHVRPARRAAASRRRWDSRRSTACRWARAAARSIPASCCS